MLWSSLMYFGSKQGKWVSLDWIWVLILMVGAYYSPRVRVIFTESINSLCNALRYQANLRMEWYMIV